MKKKKKRNKLKQNQNKQKTTTKKHLAKPWTDEIAGLEQDMILIL